MLKGNTIPHSIIILQIASCHTQHVISSRVLNYVYVCEFIQQSSHSFRSHLFDPSLRLIVILFICCGFIHLSVHAASIQQLATIADCNGAMSLTKDVSTGMIYAACLSSSRVIAIKTQPQPVVTILPTATDCTYPNSVSTDSTGKLFVACLFRGVISMDTLANNAIVHLADGSPGKCMNPRIVYKPHGQDVVAACNNEPPMILTSSGSTNIASFSDCPWSTDVCERCCEVEWCMLLVMVLILVMDRFYHLMVLLLLLLQHQLCVPILVQLH